MSERKINIYSNDTALSRETEKKLCLKLKDADFKISEKLTDDCELMICIGGDGAFLEAIHLYKFPGSLYSERGEEKIEDDFQNPNCC